MAYSDYGAQKDCMFYVAEDPAQLGAAFAACADEPKYAEHTAADLADWSSRSVRLSDLLGISGGGQHAMA